MSSIVGRELAPAEIGKKEAAAITENTKRLTYIDNLRLLVIILVVAFHVAVTYNGFGNWYVIERGAAGPVQAAVMGFFQAFNQSFYMGFLFLVAGYFAPSSYDRRGLPGFLKERFVRLLVPSALYILAIDPFIHIALLGTYGLADYFGNLLVFDRISSLGPMWFTVALFVFSAVYALVRKIAQVRLKELPFPKTAHILLLIPALGVCVFAGRLVFSIDVNFFNMRLGFFVQYIVMFSLGIMCGRQGFFERPDLRKFKAFLPFGIAAGAVSWPLMMYFGLGGFTARGWSVFHGGASWQSAAYALWESFVAVCMSAGLLAVFKEKCNSRGRLVKSMSKNAFNVYFSHAVVLTALALLFRGIEAAPLLKFLLLCAVGIPASFLFAGFVISPVHRIFLLLHRKIRVKINSMGGKYL